MREKCLNLAPFYIFKHRGFIVLAKFTILYDHPRGQDNYYINIIIQILKTI